MIGPQVMLTLQGYEADIRKHRGRMDVHMLPMERTKKMAELDHLLEMIPKAIQFIYDQRIEKAMRWLGFIQGSLWTHGIFTIEEMKNHNRGTEEE